MHKKEVINELEEIIKTLNYDKRTSINGIKIMVCDQYWKHRKKANDSNLLIDWGDKI